MLHFVSTYIYEYEYRNIRPKKNLVPFYITLRVTLTLLLRYVVWFFSRCTSSKTVIPEEYTFHDPSLPNKLVSRPLFLYRAQQMRREKLGLPRRSSYMVEIHDCERDEPYEFKGDYPKRWWKYG